MAGILGNLMVVAPLVIAVQLLAWWALGAPLITEEKAHDVLESMTLLGPTLWYAAFTGVLLFASSIIAGWVENWFVLHRLDSALRWNPRIRARLGAHRAARWSVWWRENISGLAANISLGFMLASRRWWPVSWPCRWTSATSPCRPVKRLLPPPPWAGTSCTTRNRGGAWRPCR